MSLRHHTRHVVAALALAGMTLTGTVVLSATSASPAHAWQLSSLVARDINAARASYHLAALRERADLDLVAGRHARRLARDGRIYHNRYLASQVRGWTRLGENVGVGSSVAQVSRAFMRSSGHRANILSRSFRDMGVGAAYGRGRVWIVQIFRQPATTGSSYAATSTRSAVAVTPRTATAHPVLRYGSRGSAVQRVQVRLRITADGVFGPQTLAAVTAFQRSHRLVADGIVGPNTWRALGI